MRGYLAAALLLASVSAGHTQYFSFPSGTDEPVEVFIPRACGGPSCVYVHVPGYVEIGRRPYAPFPPPPYYGPPPSYDEGPPGYPRPRGYAPPPDAYPDYTDEDDLPPRYAPPPAARRPIRQPRQIQSAQTHRKKLPRVAAIPHMRSPERKAAKAAPVPVPKPVPDAASAAPKPAATPAPAIPSANSQAPSTPPKPAAAPATPDPTVDPKSAAQAVPEAPAQRPAPPQQVAAITSPPAAGKPTRMPGVAEMPDTKITPAAPSAAPPPVKPPQLAALPSAKRDFEDRAKPLQLMPIGVWSSSDGQMRIAPCGRNLCGYAVGGRHAGRMVLIQMRQTHENSWSGQVNDVRSGQNYSATMSMRGPNALNIQGCAFGGLFCGGRVMTRVQ